jgi:hypothetical protein
LNSSSITDGDNIKWHCIGEARDHLLKELTELYWTGVEHELEAVLVALRSWKKHAKVDFEEEEDTFFHGFDTFIDQISEESHAFADKVRQWKDGNDRVVAADYIQNLRQSAELEAAEHQKARLKQEIRDSLEYLQPDKAPARRRARLLLQSLGLLDIDKLVEHRPPLDDYSFWKRPAVPQLKLDKVTQHGIPILEPMRCTHCRTIIRGSMYRRPAETANQELRAENENICEECFLKHFLTKPNAESFSKMYKHCVLNEIVHPRLSRKICLCEEVPHYDNKGMSLNLYPVSKNAQHRKADGPGAVECGLLQLGPMVAEAKFEGMRRITARSKPKKNGKPDEKNHEPETEKSKVKTANRPKTVTQQSQQAPDRDETTGTAVALEEAEADEDIPYFLRQYAERYPFGNVHMALRVGPIVIENGVR